MLACMSLSHAIPTGFIPTANAEAARAFYEGTLGLRFVADERFALVFRLGPEPGTDLRVVRVGSKHQPVEFTIFGWEVETIEKVVDELTAKGVQFRRYPGMEQDERAIWHAPGRAKIAWFQDPDGNTLSIAEHSA
jgi:catechol 2,3-dioxygenase-like lactoylglutathione lyase family enzyme